MSSLDSKLHDHSAAAEGDRVVQPCKTRQTLRDLMDSKNLVWSKNATIVDLKKELFEHGMKEVNPHCLDSMGFGKHAEKPS